MLKDLIQANKDQFLMLCRSHKIKSLFAFGSSVNGTFTLNSDIDLLVDVAEPNPIYRGELLLSLWDKLELFFNKKVDLITSNSLRNPILKENIERQKKQIYDGSKEEILL